MYLQKKEASKVALMMPKVKIVNMLEVFIQILVRVVMSIGRAYKLLTLTVPKTAMMVVN